MSLPFKTKNVDDLYGELEESVEEVAELKRKLAVTREAFVESVELEQFWRRAAEQALRLWDRAQDELEAHGLLED